MPALTLLSVDLQTTASWVLRLARLPNRHIATAASYRHWTGTVKSAAMFVQEEKIFAGKVLKIHICTMDGTEWLEEVTEDTTVEKLKERCLKHVGFFWLVCVCPASFFSTCHSSAWGALHCAMSLS